MVQMGGVSCVFLKKDQLGHLQLPVMAYVDDLVISGGAQTVRELTNDSARIHAHACQFPHFRESGRVSGKNNQETQEWQHHHGFL